jgi:hypothetical protein
VLAVLSLPEVAAGATSDRRGHMMTTAGCYDQASFVSVQSDRVQKRDGDASNDLVPEDYELRSDDGATVALLVGEIRCDGGVTIGDTVLPGPVSVAFVGPELRPRPDEHPSAVPDNSCALDDRLDFYLLALITDSKPFADWLRAGTGLSAYHAPGIVHDYTIAEPFGVAPFRFEAPAPPDWAFKVDGAAGAQNETCLFVDFNWWQDTKTPDGKTWTAKLGFPYHRNYIAPAAVTVMATTPGSTLEEILPTNPATPTAAFGTVQAPWTGTKEVISRK